MTETNIIEPIAGNCLTSDVPRMDEGDIQAKASLEAKKLISSDNSLKFKKANRADVAPFNSRDGSGFSYTPKQVKVKPKKLNLCLFLGRNEKRNTFGKWPKGDFQDVLSNWRS